MDNNKEVFAKNLAYYIELSGKTQKDIAHEIRISETAMSSYVSGEKFPRIDKLERLAKHFGVSKSDLIEDNEKTHSAFDREWNMNFNGVGFSKEETSMIITFAHFILSRRGKGQ